MLYPGSKFTRSGRRYWVKKIGAFERRGKRGGGCYAPQALKRMENQLKRWNAKSLRPWMRETPERRASFESSSEIPLKRVYTPLDVSGLDYHVELGLPGAYPYTRGVYPTMYRGRLWTVRMFSGFGSPEDTNVRLKRLLAEGETGLSIAFDMPTLYGYDANHERAYGEVGKCGVNVSSLKDMEVLMDGIPLDEVSTSMTINAPATVLTCMYIAVAEKRGIPRERLRGTVQTDMLKEYSAQKEWAFPPEAHLRLIRDMTVYCTRHMPHWHYISISGYHIREAGANAVQELAFTLADGFSYVELGLEAGLKVDEFAPRLSFFFNCDMDFFEEVAKFRAARRIWAKVLKERYGAEDPRSLMLRFHTQTSGASLTWQQPLNNIVRTTVEALAAVLGGAQSLHTNSYDEAWALPTEEAAVLALRTQQILAEETGIADVLDPLGGSYFVEWLTDRIEERVYRYLHKIEGMGGMLEAIKTGFIQREISETAYRRQRQVERGDRVIVGVNKHAVKEQPPIETLRIDEEVQRRQIDRVKAVRGERDAGRVRETLSRLRAAFEDHETNCMYPMLEAVEAYATLGEIMGVGREVFGEWREPSIL